ncbi:MAG TPA: 50S ribosomal protein L4 [Acidimicrobiales bacterium]|nr:50S ribosomal protein L4 [Acidimicrobiales bacterium]
MSSRGPAPTLERVAASPGYAEHSRPRLDEVVVERRSPAGEVLGNVRLDPEHFSTPINVVLLHQVVTAQLAGRRAGTQSTRTRAEVRGGSKKPYRQKGTGNARQGSIRAPHYSGGGIALGPKPRSYAQRTPSKMIRQALRCALSDRAASGQVVLVDDWGFEVPRTRDAAAALAALGCGGSVLVVLERANEVAARSFANIPHVSTVPLDQLTAYDVLIADWVIFDDATLPGESSTTQAAATVRGPRPVIAPVRARSSRTSQDEAGGAAPGPAAAPSEAGEAEAAGDSAAPIDATDLDDAAGAVDEHLDDEEELDGVDDELDDEVEDDDEDDEELDGGDDDEELDGDDDDEELDEDDDDLDDDGEDA